jgi:hypothetical protein
VSTLAERWEVRFLAHEAGLCCLTTGLLVAVSEVIVGPGTLDRYLVANRFTVFPAVVGADSALLGLVIAATALVLDRLAEGRLALVQQSRHIADLPRIFKSAMAWLGAATLASVVALVPLASNVADRGVAYVWTLSTLLVAARLARVIWATGLLMDIVSRQESP